MEIPGTITDTPLDKFDQYEYSLLNGPWMDLPIAGQIARETGIPCDPNLTNCQRFVHQVYRDCFGVALPAGMLSAEIFEGTPFFIPVGLNEQQYPGDIYLFYPAYKLKKGSQDPRDMHLAVGLGIFSDGKPLLADASWHKKGVAIRWLPELTRPVKPSLDPKYQLAGIRRLVPEIWDTSIKPIIFK